MNRRLIECISLLVLSVATLSAQSAISKSGTTAAPFLQIGVGARACALGGAFTATANDVSALYWNPAGLERVQENMIAVNYAQWIAGMSFLHAGLVLHAGSTGSFGFSVTTLSTPEMDVTTVDEPDGLGSRFDASDIAIGVSYAKMLTDRFTFGGTAKYVNRRIWHMSANAIAADFGIQYTLPWKSARFGMSISNFGSKMRMEGVDEMVFTDIDLTKSGNNTAVLSQLRTKEWPLPLVFRFGVAVDVFSSSMHSVTLMSDYVNPNDNDESVNAGLEYVFDDLLMVRVGYQNLFLKDSEESLTFGGGMTYEGIGFNYAYTKLQHLNYVHQFTLSVQF